MNVVKKWFLKKILKSKVLEFYRVLETFTCGMELATFISTRAGMLKLECEDLHRQLVKVDPDCPKLIWK